MVTSNSTILVLAPHTDDGEFGCGASIAKFLEIGAEVYYTAFSLAEESVPPQFPKNILETEVKAATKELGIKPENLILFRYKVRHLANHRQEVLEDLITLSRNIKPDLVFMPCIHDLHQDHSTVAMEGLRTFKRTTILGYEIPWNNMNFATQGFITCEERHIETKLKALDCYNSQKAKSYASEKFIRSLAINRGIQIGQEYAEAFEVIRWVI